jgi:hypothetical protein
MSHYSYFSGFAWALPHAFREPLGACLFEEGDTIYNCKEGYLQWNTALKHLSHSVTVRLPKGSLGKNVLREEDSAVFERNWYTTVEFELVDYRSGERQIIQTTQGRLYSFLRTGDLGVLKDDFPSPKPPVLVVQANKRLEEVRSAITSFVADEINNSDLFIIAFDITNPISRAKPDAIRACLRNNQLNIIERIVSPRQLRLANWEIYAPTISFLVFCTAVGAREKFRDSLKRALYKPTKGRKSDRENFNLRNHGLFVPAILDSSKSRLSEAEHRLI